MMHKGYAHPLHSLDLLRPHEAPADEPRYLLPVPEGRLALRPELRRRGRALSSDACERAVTVALSLRASAAAAFAACGFDDAWAASLRHHLGRLWAEEDARGQLEVAIGEHQRRRAAALLHGRALLTRLRIAASLAGVALGGGRAPRAELSFLEALGQLSARLEEPSLRAALEPAGFQGEHVAQLREAHAWLGPARLRADELDRAKTGCSDRIAVLRGALFGDLGRLCRAAPAVPRMA